MRIGIITNCDFFIPLTYTLAAQQQQVYIFYSPSDDELVNQKTKAFIKENSLPFTEEKNNSNAIYQWLLQGNYDACFVFGYNKLIEPGRLKNSTTPVFNIHFGPLPGFKGPSPVFWQLKYGLKKIGLAIHYLSNKFDEGPVVWTKDVDNLPHDNYITINQKLSSLSVEGIFYILSLIVNKLPVPVINNKDAVPAYQKRPALGDVLINWPQMDATEICNLVRACNPWNKGALTLFNGYELKLMDAGIIAHQYSIAETMKPGTIMIAGDFLHIFCFGGGVINVNMFFLNDCFVPAYQCSLWGLMPGTMLG
ncbi:formyltransferase family protein [Mucilaginibacter sp.]|uniref:formyltransferase family protein n=1 Tax=Mucilaginibacter sp. TaxID=1882438 RepID=UPI002841A15C|nr:formyltransferase family protein [Mucilaginibacter sp.]MDR3697523.1 formyltransferase family protein [Mucilaginibacter sp.]